MAYAKFEDERDDRREPEDENRNRKKGGLRAFFAPENRPALMALSMGITSAARGGDFGTGLARGMQMMELQNENRRQEDMMRQREQYMAGLPEEDRMLAALAPDQYFSEAAKARFGAGGSSATSKQKDYEFLLSQGMSPGDALKMLWSKKGSSLRVLPDGTVEFSEGEGGPLSMGPGKNAQREADKAIGQGAQTVEGAEKALAAFRRAQDVLPKLRTGLFAPARQLGAQIGSELGIEGAQESAAMWDELEAIEKDLGISQLQLLGGNDTERELLTSIQTTIGRTKQPEANAAILQRKAVAAALAIEKQNARTQWASRYGSLVNPNEQGMTFDQAWSNGVGQRLSQIEQQFPVQSLLPQRGGRAAPQQGGGRLRYNAETGELEPMQ